jgi:hypothetical protein
MTNDAVEGAVNRAVYWAVWFAVDAAVWEINHE